MAVHLEFESRWRPAERVALARQRREIEGLMKESDALAVAGGHVAVLLNRLRLFGLEKMVGSRPVIAWSAGAMALSELVVLFHDNPPQGKGRTEVLENGLGLAPGVIPLPHARHRLHLDDHIRITYFARRFAHHLCCPMDEGARLDWNGVQWIAPWGGSALAPEGTLVEVPAA